MRAGRFGWGLALLISVALLGVWLGAAVVSADTVVNPFAGNWSTFGGTGMLTLDAQTASKGEASTAYYSDGAADCGTDTTYYAGDYRVSDDSGYIAGCTDAAGTHLMAWYRSAVGSQAGTISITVASGFMSFTGTYDETSDGTGGAYDGTFTSDSDGSGRSAPSKPAPPTITGEPCLDWNVTGTWSISQSNDYHPTWHLTQVGDHITGTEVLSTEDEDRGDYDGTTSSLTGTIEGDTLEITVTSPPKNDGPPVEGEFLGDVTSTDMPDDADVSGPAGAPGDPQADGVTWSGVGTARCIGAWRLGFTFENASGMFDGHGEGQSCSLQGAGNDLQCVTPNILGGIADAGCRLNIHCAPGIDLAITGWKFNVEALTPKAPFVAWRQPPTARILTLTVRVSGSSSRLCPVGDVGTAVLTDRDLLNSSTNVHASAFSLGGWARPCANQTFDLDGLSRAARSPTGPPLKPGQFAVLVNIDCVDGTSSGWNPAACGS
jgi:hypothetical protein